MSTAEFRAKTEARPVANICFLTFFFSSEAQYKSTGQTESEEQASFIYQSIRRNKKSFSQPFQPFQVSTLRKSLSGVFKWKIWGLNPNTFSTQSINSGRTHLSSQQMSWRLLIFFSITFPFITLELYLFPRRTRQWTSRDQIAQSFFLLVWFRLSD